MASIKIYKQLSFLRKQKGLTQEELAQIFGVTNQSVSKWESGISCPDISLLPDIADYFGVSLDVLFGKSLSVERRSMVINDVPWNNDDTVRIVVYLGKTMLNNPDDLSKLSFTLEGEIKNVECRCNLQCGNIQGNANAGCDIHCGDVTQSNGALGIGGQAVAGCDINSGNINGGASAGCNINSGNISGGVNAGTDINCGEISGGVNAGNDIRCGNISGGADAGNDIFCGDISGGADADNDINCKKIEGDVSCAGDITCEIINGDVKCDGDIIYSK